MNRLRTCLLTAAACLALAAPALAQDTQDTLDGFARQMGYSFTVMDVRAPGGMTSRIDLVMPHAIPKGAWSLYFGMLAPVASIDSDVFEVSHVNGDLYRLTPKAGTQFTGGQTYPVVLHTEGGFLNESHVLPNAYVAEDGLQARVIDATKPAVDPASGQETLPFVAPMTDEATQNIDDNNPWLTPQRLFEQTAQRQTDIAAPEFAILPTPKSARHLTGPAVNLTSGVRLTLSGVAQADIQTAFDDLKSAGIRASAAGVPLSITIDAGSPPESYHLHVGNGAVAITAADSAGAAYALESLAQQAVFEHGRVRPMQVDDAPRFPFRGLHLDLARNFESKAHILKIIDVMQMNKLNKLHLHLGDDEGWRVQIGKLPELTDIGSHRCHDLTETTCLLPMFGAGPQGSPTRDGYLTRQDYIDILKAAKAHHIEVIPSFDMPGHSRAAVKSMEARARRLIAAGQPAAAAEYRLQDPDDTTVYHSVQYYNDNTLNICLDSTYHFIDTVIDDIKSMHDKAGLPLRIYHIGTDETAGAWTGSPVCQKLMADQHLTIDQLGTRFITKVSQMLDSKGIEPAGWSDGMGAADPGQMPKKVQSNSWGGLFGGGVKDAYRQANLGWDIVMSTPETLYLDMPYAADPKERGLDWASRNTDLFKVFTFMPENLPANASIMTDKNGNGGTIADTVPLTGAGHITGMQGQLWSELVRSNQIADYMLFPRVEAVAERAWHRGDWEPDYVPGRSYSWHDGQVDQGKLLADWQGFNARLGVQLKMLDARGVAWRMPVPGARITGSVLEANVPYGNLAIQYRVTGGAWTRYTGPVAVRGPVELRTVASDGKRYSRTINIE